MTRDEFLKHPNAWGSHRWFLWQALQNTVDSPFPVIELGCGDNSTPYLKQYCEDGDRSFSSFDSDKSWADKYGSYYVRNWDLHSLWLLQYSVCLLDMAPGEYRKVALMKINAEIIVIHDSEPIGWNASDYKVRPLFKNFKYMIDDKPKEKGEPWTSALSNTIDVTKFSVSCG